MSTGVVSIRLPDELKQRLDALSASTGRPVAFHVREALNAYLDDWEYACALKAEAEAVWRGEAKTISMDQMRAELGLSPRELDASSGE